MAATMMVERLMAIAPTAIGRSMPHGTKHAHGDRDRHEVVAGRPDQVLDHLGVRRTRQLDGRHDVPRVAPDKDDAGRLDGDVGAGADRDPHIGRRQRRCVVHAVTDHGHLAATFLEALDRSGLVGWQDLCGDLVDAEPASDRVGHGLAVAGDHRHPDAQGVQGVDRLLRLGSNLVLHRDDAGDLAIDDDVEDGPALTIPLGRDGQRLERGVGDEARSADGHGMALDLGTSTSTRQRLERGRGRD